MCKPLTLIFLALMVAEAQTSPEIMRLKSKAERGDAVSQFWLGAAYESGDGAPQDYNEALRWLTRSAKQGNADAQNLLGMMYDDGEGVPVNYTLAAKWYRTACENRPDRGGAGQGCNHLGQMYLKGLGVKRSLVEAYKYFKFSPCSACLAEVKSQMSLAGIEQAERAAQAWIKAHPDK